YDVEILEIHHNKKKDAPSGTANRIAEIIARDLKSDVNKVKVCGREGMLGARKKEEIGVHSVRAGDVVGEHTVFFAGEGERIELIHRAHSRDAFASGALFAAKWLIDKPKGLYNMEDVLDLK
ncbi:4-hydroxy-tetrahydrodipicolinate reductase, partial [bacterium]|nr:4-hydroxy-tetrahydrodipicolinate reductase [bacterium]